jgi:hypothetical protein
LALLVTKHLPLCGANRQFGSKITYTLFSCCALCASGVQRSLEEQEQNLLRPMACHIAFCFGRKFWDEIAIIVIAQKPELKILGDPLLSFFFLYNYARDHRIFCFQLIRPKRNNCDTVKSVVTAFLRTIILLFPIVFLKRALPK